MTTLSLSSPFGRFRRFSLAGALLLGFVSFGFAADAGKRVVDLPRDAATAATGGTIVGRVSNAATGAYLEGAEVTLDNQPTATLTTRDGGFTIAHVSAGAHTVRARYAGLDVAERPVDVAPGQTVTVGIGLTSGVYQLQAFTVSAEREGNAASITRQRNASNIINVVSLDAYGDVADGNLGNFMQKLPGVAVQNAEGDNVGVMLRGAPPNMSMVTIDGTQMTAAASPQTGTIGDRATSIDRVPAEFIKEIEITKASRPDMDASGLGGAAKLITKSAFDFKERAVTTFRAGLNKNTYRSDNPWTPSAAVTLMRKFGPEDRFAFTFSGSFTQTIVTRDRVQMVHNDPTDLMTGVRFLDDKYDRERMGTGLKLEYRPDPSLTVIIDALYSIYSSQTTRYDRQAGDTGGRRFADYSIVSRAAIEAGATPLTTARATASIAPGSTSSRLELLNSSWANRGAYDLRKEPQYSVALGGKKKWGAFDVEARGTFAHDKYDRTFKQFAVTSQRIGFLFDQQKSQARPVFTQTYGPSMDDLTQGTAQLNNSLALIKEDLGTARIDGRRTFEGGKVQGYVKAGAKYQRQYRTTETWLPLWDYTGPDGVMGRAANGTNDDNLTQFQQSGTSYGMFGGFYPSFSGIDFLKANRVFTEQPNYFRPNGTSVSLRTPPSVADEAVSSAYAMGQLELGRLTAMGGVRGEKTEVQARGLFTQGTIRAQTTRTGDYTKLFPSAHLRFEPRKNLVFRASYSTTMARPSISDITPTTTVTTATSGASLGTVAQNFTGLGPQYSRNYDLMLEYYFNPVGVITAGVYRKNIDGFIASFTTPIGSGNDNGFDGQFVGYNLVTKRNLSSAIIEGYELSYDQQLRWLPRPLNTLSLFANYTHVKTDGSYDNGASALPNFVPEMYNGGVSCGFWRCQLRVSYNYTGPYLLTYNALAYLATWQSGTDSVGVSLQVRLTPRFNLSANVENVLNHWADQYTLNENRLTVSEVYGTRWTLGVSGRF
ncbi:MAG: TonB-dependent receptor [Opitutus sp.]|nr:TonB-dependent receptor [Opitutus sp.]